MELNKASLPYAKLMHHNPEKWKMKFKMLFEREKIISFSGEVSIDLKKIKSTFFCNEEFDQVQAIKPLGDEILRSAKFWVLLLALSSAPNLSAEDLMDVRLTSSYENIETLKDYLPSNYAPKMTSNFEVASPE